MGPPETGVVILVAIDDTGTGTGGRVNLVNVPAQKPERGQSALYWLLNACSLRSNAAGHRCLYPIVTPLILLVNIVVGACNAFASSVALLFWVAVLVEV